MLVCVLGVCHCLRFVGPVLGPQADAVFDVVARGQPPRAVLADTATTTHSHTHNQTLTHSFTHSLTHSLAHSYTLTHTHTAATRGPGRHSERTQSHHSH